MSVTGRHRAPVTARTFISDLDPRTNKMLALTAVIPILGAVTTGSMPLDSAQANSVPTSTTIQSAGFLPVALTSEESAQLVVEMKQTRDTESRVSRDAAQVRVAGDVNAAAAAAAQKVADEKAAAEEAARVKAEEEAAAAAQAEADRKAAEEVAAAEAAQEAADEAEEEAKEKARRKKTEKAEEVKAESKPSTDSGSNSASNAEAIARKYLGIPYVWGGTNPGSGLDCSGLTQLVYRQLGVSLPRTSGAQARAGYAVSASEARPGDLVVMGSPVHHVAVYIGNGKMIAAPKAGDVVKVQSVYSDNTHYRRLV